MGETNSSTIFRRAVDGKRNQMQQEIVGINLQE